MKQGNMSIIDYASKIKEITNSLGSIGVIVDDDDVVVVTLEETAKNRIQELQVFYEY